MRLIPPRIDRQADDPARRLTNVRVTRRKKGGVRTAGAERNAEALRIADHCVRAHLAGRCQEREREQIRSDDDEDAGRVRALDDRPEVRDAAAFVRVLQKQPERPSQRHIGEACRIAVPEHDVERFGAAAQDVEGLRITAVRDQEQTVLRSGDLLGLQAMKHRHRLSRSRSLVEERRRRDVHARQITDDGLEVQQRLEAALRNLGLIRRVRRVPSRILEDVPQNHAWRHAAVIPHADVRPRRRVAAGNRAQPTQVGMLGLGVGDCQRRAASDSRRNGLVD